MASVSFQKIQKSFGATKVIHGISFDISDGEFVVLVGPSGCGKSTLLRMLAGLEPITGGEISIDGKVINDLDSKDRDIAMVFQSYALYPHMTVRDNMAFSLKLRKADAGITNSRVANAARILNLDSLLDRFPRELSGGQRQRVAMGRAIVRDPKVFLFDEPLSNLDAKLRVEMRAEIKLLHQRTGITSVYVTHDQIEAMTLGTRIAIMKDGVIQQFGTPQDLYRRPANLFVAGFIGSPSMNFIPVTVRRQGAGYWAELTSGESSLALKLPANDALPTYLDSAVTLGIRPEAIGIAAPADDQLPCRVELVEPTGPDTLLLVRVNGANLVARVAPQDERSPGETVALSFDTSKVVLFDRQTGLRIAGLQR